MNDSLRIDRWLWFARFFKSRSLATKVCARRRVRVNGAVIAKPNHQVRDGDVLTFPQGRDIRVVRILAIGSRRGPVPEATELYEDLSPDPGERLGNSSASDESPRRESGAGRPTKADRREILRFIGRD